MISLCAETGLHPTRPKDLMILSCLAMSKHSLLRVSGDFSDNKFSDTEFYETYFPTLSFPKKIFRQLHLPTNKFSDRQFFRKVDIYILICKDNLLK